MTPLLVLAAAAPFAFTLSPADQEMYGETYSIVFDGDDGTYALLQMAVSNIGPGDDKGACRAVWVPSKGEARTDGATYAKDEWKLGSDFVVGPCTLKAAPNVEMSVVAGPLNLDVKIAAAPKPVRPPNHRIETSAGSYEMEILVPNAPASLTVGGKALTGRAFMNHSRNTALPSKIARRWVRYRALHEGSTHLALIRFAPGVTNGTGWAMRENPESVKRARVAQKTGPLFRAQLQTGEGPWTITSRKLLFRDAPLERYGFLGAVLRAILGNPVTYTYRASGPGGAGIFEVSVVE